MPPAAGRRWGCRRAAGAAAAASRRPRPGWRCAARRATATGSGRHSSWRPLGCTRAGNERKGAGRRPTSSARGASGAAWWGIGGSRAVEEAWDCPEARVFAVAELGRRGEDSEPLGARRLVMSHVSAKLLTWILPCPALHTSPPPPPPPPPRMHATNNAVNAASASSLRPVYPSARFACDPNVSQPHGSSPAVQ